MKTVLFGESKRLVHVIQKNMNIAKTASYGLVGSSLTSAGIAEHFTYDALLEFSIAGTAVGVSSAEGETETSIDNVLLDLNERLFRFDTKQIQLQKSVSGDSSMRKRRTFWSEQTGYGAVYNQYIFSSNGYLGEINENNQH